MRSILQTGLLTSISTMIGITLPPTLLLGLGSGYSDDSFYTLDSQGRSGLVLLSAVLTVVLFTLSVWKTRTILTSNVCIQPFQRALLCAFDLVSTLVFLYLALYLVPQMYYLYYQRIIDGLPTQLVIGWPPSLYDFLKMSISRGPESLSYHLQGAIIRTLLVLTLLLHTTWKHFAGSAHRQAD